MPEEGKKQPYRPGIDPISTKADARTYIRKVLKDHDYSQFDEDVIATFNFLVGPNGGFNVIMAIKMAIVHHGISSQLRGRPSPDTSPPGERET